MLAVNDSYVEDGGPSEAVAAPGVLGNDVVAGSPAQAVIVEAPTHGILMLHPDGSFEYAEDPGYTGPDTFTYRLVVAGRESNVATVRLQAPVPAPSPTPTESASPRPSPAPSAAALPPASSAPSVPPGPPPAAGLTIPTVSDGSTSISLGNADLLSGSFEWLVPGIVLTVPGLLLLLVIFAQGVGAFAWVPAIRRYLGSFAFRRRADEPRAA